MSDQPPLLPHQGPLVSRRALLAGMAAVGAGRLLPSAAPASAEPLWSVYATTVWDRPVTMRTVASYSKGDDAAVVPPGTSVRVLDGPDPDGWHQIEWVGPETAVGWLHGDRLIFAQTARVLTDTGLFSGPGDWNVWLGSVRSGYVVDVIGASPAGFVLVRSAGVVGWTYQSVLETSTLPATDPNGEQWIDVNRSSLVVSLMVGSTPVRTFNSRMSSDTGDGFYATASGSWSVYSKVEGLTYTPYAKAYIMYWVGFDASRDNGFHGWTMDAAGNVINTGNTWGCIATAPPDASAIYAFSWPGMRVEVHW